MDDNTLLIIRIAESDDDDDYCDMLSMSKSRPYIRCYSVRNHVAKFITRDWVKRYGAVDKGRMTHEKFERMMFWREGDDE